MAPCGLLTWSSCLAVAKSGFVDGVGGLGPRVHASIAPKVHVAGHLCIFVSARGEVNVWPLPPSDPEPSFITSSVEHAVPRLSPAFMSEYDVSAIAMITES